MTDSFRRDKLRFGVFISPMHGLDGSTTLQLQRDLDLIELVDDLGFDEAWVGEHMSAGYATISSPEVFLAAASQRTKRIKLGTAVNALPYHRPFTLANRIVDLDHLTRGRAMMGFGPGQNVADGDMMGVDHQDVRGRMVEAAEVIVALLRGEEVTRETDWFTLNRAEIQNDLCNPDGIDFIVASVFTPSGAMLAGRLDLGLLSLAASDMRGMENLDSHWNALQGSAAEHGNHISRERWRVVGAMHLAESRERAWAEARTRALSEINAMDRIQTPRERWESWWEDADQVLEHWTTDGFGRFGGVATIGTPDDAVAAIERLITASGGFGSYNLLIHNAAPWDATKRSLELFAEYVIPAVRRSSERRLRSAARAHEGAADYGDRVVSAVNATNAKLGYQGRAIPQLAGALPSDDPATAAEGRSPSED